MFTRKSDNIQPNLGPSDISVTDDKVLGGISRDKCISYLPDSEGKDASLHKEVYYAKKMDTNSPPTLAIADKVCVADGKVGGISHDKSQIDKVDENFVCERDNDPNKSIRTNRVRKVQQR